MFIKTTLRHSNPRVIRFFYIHEDQTVRDLLAVAAILHGWQDRMKALLHDGKEIALTAKLSQVADSYRQSIAEGKGHSWAITRPMEKTVAYDFRYPRTPDEDRIWYCQMEIMEEEIFEEGLSIPEGVQAYLLRYRGLHPLEACPSITEWNDLHKQLLQKEGAYSYNMGYIQTIVCQVDLAERNDELKNYFRYAEDGMTGEDAEIDLSYGANLPDILRIYNIDRLKDIIRGHELDISLNQKKEKIVKAMVHYYNRDLFWERLIEEMSMGEYRQFKQLCIGEKDYTSQEIYQPTVNSYGLLARRNDRPIFPLEFLRYYGQVLKTRGDEQILHRKKLYQVMFIACRFYGVFTKLMCKKLLQVFYPEIDPGEISQVWKDGMIWKRLNAFIMYDKGLHFLKVQELARDKKLDDAGHYYVPSREEAEDILQYGITFSRETREELYGLIRPLLFSHEKNGGEKYIIRGIYDIYYEGEPYEEVEEFLDAELDTYRKQRAYKQLLRKVKELRDEVRMREYHGFNFREMKIRNR